MIAKFFKEEEFACGCGCGAHDVNSKLVEMLDRARDIAGIPFMITSGRRCAEWNEKVGGKEGSAHLSGYAADIACKISNQRLRIVDGLLRAGFTRIEIAQFHIHVDIDPTKPQGVLWLG